MASDLAPDVVVIGAGFAGLSAAVALAERGRRVLVLEARPGAGGRASTFTDPATGERVDNGQHVLFGAYHETFRFLDRIGSRDLVDLQPQLSVGIVDGSSRHSRLSCPPLPPPLHLLAGVLRWRALGARDRLAALRLGLALRGTAPDGTALDGAARQDRALGGAASTRPATVREWLDGLGQTRRLIDLLWEPLAVAALNESIDVAAAAPFAEVLRRLFNGSARDASLGLPRVPLEELYVPGAVRFVEARGGEVRTGSPAWIEGGERAVVRTRDGSLAPAAVVCAVPWFALPDVLAGCPLLAPVASAAGRTPASAIVTVNLWLDRRVCDDSFVGLPGRAMQWLFDRRGLVGELASHLSLVASDAAALAGESKDAITERALLELRTAIPAARDAAVRRAVVVREKRATFSVAPGLPARPSTRTPVANLYLAGDWIDTGLPATIESAVLSGHRAAEAVTRS